MAAKRILLAVTAILAASVLALVGMAGMDNTAHAQSGSLKPANVQAVNGPNAGEAIVSWDAVTGVTWYRVGWISQKDYLAAVATGGDALQSYVFADVQNTTTYTVVRLEPGENYFFTVASITKRFGASSAVSLAQLTLNSDTTACPAPTPGVTPTPTPTGTATATPTTPTPTGTTPGTGSSQFPTSPVNGDYDHDDDGFIEIRTTAQLRAMQHDPDGDGVVSSGNPATAYDNAFPDAATRMGCPDTGCKGYELAANLDFHDDASASAWIPVGNKDNHFTADFDGNGHTIANLHVKSNAERVGLFGAIGTAGSIQRVGLVDVSVVGGTDGYTGGLVGMNSGSITASYVTGTVSSTETVAVGGLAGWNGGSVTASYAAATVSGNESGGLVGINEGNITAAYATGSVSAQTHSWTECCWTTYNHYAAGGGLVGLNRGVIAASYSTGSVTSNYYSGGLVGSNERTVSDSYWDSDTSGVSVSAGGVGRTTTRLQAPTGATGIYVKWDASKWDFGTAAQYPVLKVSGLSVAAQRPPITTAAPGPIQRAQFPASPVNGDYDHDDDGFIEIRTTAQLRAMRYDPDGNGRAADGTRRHGVRRGLPRRRHQNGLPGGRLRRLRTRCQPGLLDRHRYRSLDPRWKL